MSERERQIHTHTGGPGQSDGRPGLLSQYAVRNADELDDGLLVVFGRDSSLVLRGGPRVFRYLRCRQGV